MPCVGSLDSSEGRATPRTGLLVELERGARALRLSFVPPDRAVRAQRAVLDLMPFGLLVADRSSYILLLNRAAETMALAADGLAVCRGRLSGARPVEARSLAAHIARVAATPARGNRAAAGAALRLSRPSGRPPYAVLVTPLGADGPHGAGLPRPAALVLISDPERRPAPCGRYLAELFGLTSAEASLAAALASGVSLAAYAEAAHIALATARWRLKRILAKTHTHRQSELVALVLTTPVGLGI